jgi:hypothetical protein
MKDENKASARGSDVKKGKTPESVQNVERVGSKGGEGISFPLHAHPDKSVVSKGNLKE